MSQTRPSRSLVGKVAIVTGAGTQGEGIGNGRAIAILLAEDGAAVVGPRAGARLRGGRDARRGVPGGGGGGGADVWARRHPRQQRGRAGRAGHGDGDGRGGVGARARGQRDEHGAHGQARDPGDAAQRPGRRRGRGRGIRGSIVNVGSVAGLRGGTPSLLYPTSKGAVVNMTRAMAAHHGAQGVRVNCVCPGMLYTPMMHSPGEGAAPMSAETREARRRRSLLGTEGSAWDAAAAVRFLAGGEARWITGTVLTVDAGATCSTAIAMD
ncbi:hypothetical protein ACCO45_006505 [Purpureocillium lilacinum]|uniref:Uncharacterized protein n=1 Tax=Purpureocillium lilacinum TaxID=33203 RepID=A0ACC4DSR8_PURLI